MERLLQMLPLEWRLHSVGELASGQWVVVMRSRLYPGVQATATADGPVDACKAAIALAVKNYPSYCVFRVSVCEPQLMGSSSYRGRTWDDVSIEIGGEKKRKVRSNAFHA